MNLSVSTWNYLCSYSDNADLASAVNDIRTNKFGLELWLDWGPDLRIFEKENWNVLRKLTAGISAMSLHSSFWVKEEHNLDNLRKEIDLGEYLGVRILVVHAGTLNISNIADLTKGDVICGRIREVVEYAKKRGVILAIENDDSIIILRRLVDLCGIKVCIDVGHANFDSQNSPMDFLNEFPNDIVHFHFSDNDGSSDQHLVPGAGNVIWKPILKRLKELKFYGQCVLEINGDNALQSAFQARDYLVNIWREE